MSKHNFVKGEFETFRVVTQIHLGRLERYLEKDEEIEFDGHTLKYEGDNHALPQLRGAVMSGWLVPSTDTTSTYKPKSANIHIRPAQAANIEDRGKPMPVTQAYDDNKVVGTVHSTSTTEGGGEVSGEGETVGKIATPARQRTTLTDTSAAQQEINRLSNNPPPAVTKTATATGDVDEAIVGDTLEDVLPNAATASSTTPKKTAKTAKSKVVTLSNGVEWDMGRHWRTRGRDATKSYGSDTETLSLIQAVEVPSVVKMITERLSKS